MARMPWRMLSGLSLMFLLYAGLQLTVVAKAGTALALTWPVIIVLVAWVALMTVQPLLVWRWEQLGRHRLVLVSAWVGYSWMGVVFLLFWILLAFDVLGVLLRLGGTRSGLSVQDSFLLGTILTAGVSIYGFVAARRLRIERVLLTSTKFPAGSRPLRIALISDVHLGALVGVRRLRAIIEKLRALDADVVISAGDLVDGQAEHLNGLAPLLAALQPRLGKFAVTGNHEYYVGLDRALEFHTRAGFRVLRGAAVEVSGALRIVGVDDPTGYSLGLAANTDESRILEASPRNLFTILVKHQPRLDARVLGHFDLQLSGHVHRGQIFPFGLLVRLSYPLPTGLTRIAGGGWLYVSRGTGTWGPPLRVLAAPEITLIELHAG